MAANSIKKRSLTPEHDELQHDHDHNSRKHVKVEEAVIKLEDIVDVEKLFLIQDIEDYVPEELDDGDNSGTFEDDQNESSDDEYELETTFQQPSAADKLFDIEYSFNDPADKLTDTDYFFYDPATATTEQKLDCIGYFDERAPISIVGSVEACKSKLLQIINIRKQQAAKFVVTSGEKVNVFCWQHFRLWQTMSADEILKFMLTGMTDQVQKIIGCDNRSRKDWLSVEARPVEDLYDLFIYTDLLEDLKTHRWYSYVGSASSVKGGIARLMEYCAFRIKGKSSEKCQHVTKVMDQTCQPHFRVLCRFPPNTSRLLINMAEGIIVDLLGSLLLDETSGYITPEIAQAYTEAAQMSQMQGLNRAHPFSQGSRGKGYAKYIKAQDGVCIACGRAPKIDKNGNVKWSDCKAHELTGKGIWCENCRIPYVAFMKDGKRPTKEEKEKAWLKQRQNYNGRTNCIARQERRERIVAWLDKNDWTCVVCTLVFRTGKYDKN